MDQAISAVIGGLLFAAFVAGLAESIRSPAFIFIVFLVISLMVLDVYQTVKENALTGKSKKPKS